MKNLINELLDRREDVESINIYVDKDCNAHISILPRESETMTLTYKTKDGQIWERTFKNDGEVEKKPKTFLGDLLEKYPNAILTGEGYPRDVCPFDLGYMDEQRGDYCNTTRCMDCWNQPMEE